MSLNSIKTTCSPSWKHSGGTLARTWVKPREQALRYQAWNLFIDIVFSAMSASDRNGLVNTKWSGTSINVRPLAFPFWLFVGCFNFFPFVMAVAPLPINPAQVRLSYLIRTWNPLALQTD